MKEFAVRLTDAEWRDLKVTLGIMAHVYDASGHKRHAEKLFTVLNKMKQGVLAMKKWE